MDSRKDFRKIKRNTTILASISIILALTCFFLFNLMLVAVHDGKKVNEENRALIKQIEELSK